MKPNILFDANVLYSGLVRDLLMRLALTGNFQAKWTDAIQDEWIRNLSQNRRDLPRANHENVRRLMDEALPDARVTAYEHLIPTLNLPDPDDRHVLAAAIHCQATIVVTFNLKDFPLSALAPFGIIAQHPAEFAIDLLDQFPDDVLGVVKGQRVSLRKRLKSRFWRFSKATFPNRVSMTRGIKLTETTFRTLSYKSAQDGSAAPSRFSRARSGFVS